MQSSARIAHFRCTLGWTLAYRLLPMASVEAVGISYRLSVVLRSKSTPSAKISFRSQVDFKREQAEVMLVREMAADSPLGWRAHHLRVAPE